MPKTNHKGHQKPNPSRETVPLSSISDQYSGSMTFWGGSGSGSSDPCFWILDPDPAIFVIDLQDASKKQIFNTIFSAYYFLKVHLHHFSKIKSKKESQNRRNKGFSYYFCMMIEGSGRPKNMWIRWIRIRNTVSDWNFYLISDKT